jgi:zinc/manganese transport system permease protein
MAAPFAACMVLVAMLAYLGVHIIARGVIFVDLSLAQMAALGSTCSLIFGLDSSSATGYAFALAFALLGALIFATTRVRRERRRVPQEAIIGIVYVVASAAGILVADRAPQGAEAIKEVLVGSILWVTWPAIGKMLLVYLGVAVVHWYLRHRFLTISLHEDEAERQGWRTSCSTPRSGWSSPWRSRSPACSWSSPSWSCRRWSPSCSPAAQAT